jgi:hypothetical protein
MRVQQRQGNTIAFEEMLTIALFPASQIRPATRPRCGSVFRMFNHAIAGQPLPKRVSTDHYPLFRFHRWLANLAYFRFQSPLDCEFATHTILRRKTGTEKTREVFESLRV